MEFFAQLNRELKEDTITPTDGDDFYQKLEHDLNFQDPARSRVAITVLSVACGKTHSMALTDCGLYAWGSSKYGQLGLGRDKLVNVHTVNVRNRDKIFCKKLGRFEKNI